MKFLFPLVLIFTLLSINANANPIVKIFKPKTTLATGVGVATVKQVKKKSAVASLLNISGHVLTVAMLSTMFTGEAKASSFEYSSSGAKFYEQGNLIHIDVDCNAYSSAYGDGQWGWNENGWGIYLEDSENVTTFEYSLDNMPKFTQNILNKCKIK